MRLIYFIVFLLSYCYSYSQLKIDTVIGKIYYEYEKINDEFCLINVTFKDTNNVSVNFIDNYDFNYFLLKKYHNRIDTSINKQIELGIKIRNAEKKNRDKNYIDSLYIILGRYNLFFSNIFKGKIDKYGNISCNYEKINYCFEDENTRILIVKFYGIVYVYNNIEISKLSSWDCANTLKRKKEKLLYVLSKSLSPPILTCNDD